MPSLLNSPTALESPSTEARSTQHGLLVAVGHFAAEIGLLAQLPTVRTPQKTVTHTPAAKLTTFGSDGAHTPSSGVLDQGPAAPDGGVIAP